MDKQNDNEDLKGRCISCGFAGKRAASGPKQEYYEITKSERETQLNLSSVPLPNTGGVAFRLVGTQLACCRHVADLTAEVRALHPKDDKERKDAAQQIFEEDRHCPEWYPYQSGHDPEWHLNDYRMQQLENERRAFELKLFEVSEQLQKDNLRAARWNLIAAIVFGVIVVILSIMQLRLASKPPTVIIQQPNQQQPAETNPQPVEPSNEPLEPR